MKKIVANLFLEYIRLLARIQLRKHNPVIVGITGSAGKTSARQAASIVLSLKGSVKESHKANSETGIPLNILGITVYRYSLIDWIGIAVLAPLKLLTNWQKFDYYIVEMGVDSPYRPKNMSYLLSIIKPHIGIILNADLVHTEPFDHLVKDRSVDRRKRKLIELIAAEKGKLVTTMNSSSNVAIINYDQKEIRALAKRTKARILTFGRSKRADMIIKSHKSTLKSFEMTISHKGDDHNLKIDGVNLSDHYAYTLSSAIALGISLGIPPAKSISALATNFTAPKGRWNILEGIKGSTIIDSSYNASPLTMKQALLDLKKLAGRKHKVAVLGDMRELGKESKQAHKDLAIWAAKSANEIILFGQSTKSYTLPILERKKRNVHHFEYMDDLVDYLKKVVKPTSHILVKGSQNTLLLERAVEAILKYKKDAGKLARRGKYWDRVRSITP